MLEEVERRLAHDDSNAATRTLVPPSGYEDLVGWFPQQRQLRSLGDGPLPGARADVVAAAGRLALASERWANGRLRTTAEQGIVDPQRARRIPRRDRHAARPMESWRPRRLAGPQRGGLHRQTILQHRGHRNQGPRPATDRAACGSRSLELHGIHIHMSGCPSACANHSHGRHRAQGRTRETAAGDARRFRRVPRRRHRGQAATRPALSARASTCDQLAEPDRRSGPRISTLQHNPGETFSDYWRDELRRRQPAAAKEEDFQPPVWECDSCKHRHLRRRSAGVLPAMCRVAATLRSLGERGRMPPNDRERCDPFAVDRRWLRGGRRRCGDSRPNVACWCDSARIELALFRVGDQICAFDNACPHAGGSLADGTLADGCVTCPLHGWKFDACTGAGVVPAKSGVATSIPRKSKMTKSSFRLAVVRRETVPLDAHRRIITRRTAKPSVPIAASAAGCGLKRRTAPCSA